MRARSILFALAVLFALPALAQESSSSEQGKSIAWVRFRGNRKAEDDAIRLAISLRPGDKLDADRLRDDIKAVWKMGYFEDVQVEATEEGGKIGLTFVLREKP